MLVDGESLSDNSSLQGDITIVGAGPAGIVLAMELEKAGLNIILVESGRLESSSEIQNLGQASSFDPKTHAPMNECTRRQIGGTSTIWGGRCVPPDPIDFDFRPYITDAHWPVTYQEITKYFDQACRLSFCGKNIFDIHNISGVTQKSIIPGLPDEEVKTSCLERWTLPTNFGKEYIHVLENSKNIKLIFGLTCTEINENINDKRINEIHAKTLQGKNIQLKSELYVLACGGLETTRLLMASNKKSPTGIGDHSGLLGKYYMGHISGRIAKVHFTTPPQQTIHGYDRDSDGTYIRRRFSFSQRFHNENKLPNIVSWLVNPDIYDPIHGNGILSFVYLLLISPFFGKYLASDAIRKAATGDNKNRMLMPHFKNIIFNIPQTIKFIISFGYKRFIPHRKIPGFFVYSKSNIYPLHYHAEQIPNINSCVSLSSECDSLGMPKLKINLQYSQEDIDGVIRAHQYWDEYLRRYSCGHLEYITNDLKKSVWDQASDGFHQIGTTRMSKSPADGVVDANCKIHGYKNIFIASSSIFVTSGQANSTFTILAFTLRLAEHIKNNFIHTRSENE